MKKFKLKILGTMWDVEIATIPMIDDKKSTEDYGQTDFDNLQIRISHKNDSFKHLIHEILEVLIDNLKIALLHDDLERLEHGLAAVIRDNLNIIKRMVE